MGGGCCPTGYQCGATDCPAVTIMVSNVISGQVSFHNYSIIRLYSSLRLTYNKTDFHHQCCAPSNK